MIRLAETRGFIPCSREGLPNYQSYRSFSCMSYQDPNYINWGPVMTINDDRTKPGFITAYHEHKGLDIINYMIEGECRHVDNFGNDNKAGPGQLQHFWCGPSIWHTLSNESSAPARYLQIWIQPNLLCFDGPEYSFVDRPSEFSELPIRLKNTRLRIKAGNLSEPITVDWGYLLVLEGSCRVGDEILNEGDAFESDSPVEVSGSAHVILFEMS